MKNIFTIIIILAIIAFSFYLNSFLGILEVIVSLGIYTIIFYGIHILWKKSSKTEITNFYIYVKKFLYAVSWFVLIIFLCIGGFAFVSNEIFPAKMPEYILSNGEKIVKFQAMVHIGTREYYNKIIANLTNFKQEGGIYFFEGVKSGNEENMKKFNEALGIEFNGELYENFSKLYGVTFQDTNEFLGLVNDLDFNIDITIDDIIRLYEEKTNTLPEKKTQKMPIDANAEILKILSNVNEKELKLLIYLNQAILNFLMNNDSILESMSNTFADKELFEVILGERNKVLVNAIETSKYDKIFITYGLLHFKGVYEFLKESDNNWEIIETKYLYPIK